MWLLSIQITTIMVFLMDLQGFAESHHLYSMKLFLEVCTLLLPSNSSIPPWGHIVLHSGVGHTNVQDHPHQRGI